MTSRRASPREHGPHPTIALVLPEVALPGFVWGLRRQHLPDGLEEALHADRLRLVAVEAGGEDLAAVLRHRRSRHGDDRDRANGGDGAPSPPRPHPPHAPGAGVPGGERPGPFLRPAPPPPP